MKSKEYYKVMVPIKPIRAAIAELKSLQGSWATWDGEREQWRVTPDVERDGGFQKAQRYREELEAIDEKQQKRIEDAREVIGRNRTDCFDAINKQVTPDGADILGDNAGDFALITNGLIDRPEHLREIVERHQNAAFRNAAESYAAAKMASAQSPIEADPWAGFDYKSKEGSVREYCNFMFEMFYRAAAMPQGVSMMQALEDNEIVRAARAYDVLDCLPAE